MPRKGQLLGTCHTCGHLERPRIELLCAGGASHKALARKYGISRDSIGRHWQEHVPEERKAALAIGPVERAALSSRVAEESESVIDHYRAVRRRPLCAVRRSGDGWRPDRRRAPGRSPDGRSSTAWHA